MTDPHALMPTLIATLNADGLLAAQVVGGWHEGVAPLNTASPWGIVALVTSDVTRVFPSELSWVCLVDVTAWAETSTAADAIAARAHAVLEGAAIGRKCRRVDVIRNVERDGSRLKYQSGSTYGITT